MPERLPDRGPARVARALLGATAVAALYVLTWRVLSSVGVEPLWVAAALVVETYLVLGIAYVALVWRPAGRRGAERRQVPRVAAPIPIRWATEDGDVGVGALVDISGRGAGLLIPLGRFDAPRVWMQFLWFDDRVGMQGRVAHMRETPDGLRLGLELDRLPAQSAEVMAHYVLPFSASRVWQRDSGGRRAVHLPARVEAAGVGAWAITEDVGDDGATLLLPQGFPEGTAVTVALWGRDPARTATVVRVEELTEPPFGLHRLEVRYGAAVPPAPVPARDATLAGPRV
ncbi:MAG: PilZ domain-containing protein [Armatimonadota bacterium]|nr:PilZ domain-containing protein [Armatimonadota bacterium]